MAGQRGGARKTAQSKPQRTEAAEPTEEQVSTATVAERKGMRGHDDNGSVRPADGRWGLHKPSEESEVCVNDTAPDEKRETARRRR